METLRVKREVEERKKKRKITKKKKENETPGLWSETGEGER